MTQEDVARSLGVGRFTAFMKVTLPQIRPSVITGALFAFIGALDETVVSLFIAGGENQTLPRRMFMSLRNEIDPTIASISSVLITVSFALVILSSLRGKKAQVA
jgi:putative spermidine/putrescine transport system permease protein